MPELGSYRLRHGGTMPRSAVTGFFLLLSVAGIAAKQSVSSPPPAPPAHQTFGSGPTAIVIDAVVRHGRGRPVTGLRQQDFTLVEDGVPQKIGAFVEVAQGNDSPARGTNKSVNAGPVAAETPVAKAENVEPSGPRFLAIVFDRLSTEGRGLA